MNQIPRPKPIDIVYLYTVKKCPFTLIAEKYGVRVMIKQGYSIREMAEKLGKSPSGIARVIKKYDLRSFKNGTSEI